MIEFTPDECLSLLKATALAIEVAESAEHDGDCGSVFDEGVDRLYAQARLAGFGHLVEYNTKAKRYVPSEELEADEDITHLLMAYDEMQGVDFLEFMLATHKFKEQYGEEAIAHMGPEERIEKFEAVVDKVCKLLDEKGFDAIRLVE